MSKKFNEAKKQELRKFAETHGLRCLEKDFKFLEKAAFYYEKLVLVNEENRKLYEKILKIDPTFILMSEHGVAQEKIPRKYLYYVRNAYYVSMHYNYDLENILKMKLQKQ